MVPFILTAREQHGVKSIGDYLAKHASYIARLNRHGARYAVHEVTDRVPARIDANRWLVDCACGNCCATDAEWGIACCYACGAIYRSVIFPAAKETIEAVLLTRPRSMDRAWSPNESLQDLVDENRRHGFTVPHGVGDVPR
jgi:hypothetical protein